jgi:hypothetical protein
LAQSLQKFSNLYEVGGWKKQMELKELEIRLAYSFASQLNESPVSKFGSMLGGLFEPIFENQNHLPLNDLKLNSLKGVGFLPPDFCYPKLWIGYFRNLKESPTRDYILEMSPFIHFFSQILKEDGMHTVMCIRGVQTFTK